MDKTGELKEGQSVCDYCSCRAVSVKGGISLCAHHLAQKSASDEKPLRSSGQELSKGFNFPDSKE